MNPEETTSPAQELAEAFAQALSVSLERGFGSPLRFEITDSHEAPPGQKQPRPFRIKLEGSLRGECFIEYYESHLAESVRTSADAAPQDIPPHVALAPALPAVSEHLKNALSAKFGELALTIDPVPELACGGMFVIALRVLEQSSTPSIFLYFDGELLESLSSAAAGLEGADPAKRPLNPANLRLVMDVELNVCLRFGQRMLPLREVLELSTGSVIELDRMVDDPVDMLLDGKVVARGEAVIVDGNYGLRVTEIPQAMESHLLRV